MSIHVSKRGPICTSVRSRSYTLSRSFLSYKSYCSESIDVFISNDSHTCKCQPFSLIIWARVRNICATVTSTLMGCVSTWQKELLPQAVSSVANRNKNRYMTAPSSGLCGFNFSFRCCPCRCPVVLEKSISSDKAVQFYTMMIFPLQWMWADKHTLLRTYRSHVNRRRAGESIRGHHIKQLMA